MRNKVVKKLLMIAMAVTMISGTSIATVYANANPPAEETTTHVVEETAEFPYKGAGSIDKTGLRAAEMEFGIVGAVGNHCEAADIGKGQPGCGEEAHDYHLPQDCVLTQHKQNYRRDKLDKHTDSQHGDLPETPHEGGKKWNQNQVDAYLDGGDDGQDRKTANHIFYVVQTDCRVDRDSQIDHAQHQAVAENSGIFKDYTGLSAPAELWRRCNGHVIILLFRRVRCEKCRNDAQHGHDGGRTEPACGGIFKMCNNGNCEETNCGSGYRSG